MTLEEDDRPKRKLSHEIGSDLSLLSVGELRDRVGLLEAEIARLRSEIDRKSSSRSAAEDLFKR
ncbi:DUF1192 domain-containing protein [Rhizobium alvei]|uniref:DUF1192 domain-containing protein n=1 Tax=Rhizobium alvei TaxID=1132659 RepID=A0ABT8YNP3_9HYPH|nr:DUF1192 domain-containing protein [Rhizobium alvei]MDO6965267.1 DUF1192 domain-containing protein [Rhizobium alvei]